MILGMAEDQTLTGEVPSPGLPDPRTTGAAPTGAVRCLKAAGLRSVWMVQRDDGGPLTVKSWPLRPVTAVKWLLGCSQPQRHRRNARRLSAAGIDTPAITRGPRLVWRQRTPLLELELDYIEGRTGMELLREGDAETIAAAGSAVAELLRRLLRGGLFNRDLKLSNVLLRQEGASWQAWLLDPVDIRSLRRVQRDGVRMLERLGVEPREQGIRVPRAARRAVIQALRESVPA